MRILFTGLIPLEQPPETHALWRMALAFGAACALSPDAAVTHVVAKARGTEKVLWALRRGVHVVSKAWCAAFPFLPVMHNYLCLPKSCRCPLAAVASTHAAACA